VRGERIAVVGAGNVLMGDEGVGVEVMRALEDKVKEGALGSSGPAGTDCTDGTAGCAGEAGAASAAGLVDFIDAGTGFFTVVSALDGYKALVIIDAASGGGQPGSMYRFAVDENGGEASGSCVSGETAEKGRDLPGVLELRRAAPISLHDFGVLESIAWERVRGKLRGKIVLFGIEPLDVELRLGLSEPLEAKLDRYVERILREIEAMLK
jgi:hydrogenase maturation protease